ncbi:MAG: hypothetical protein EPO06_04115 [Burkholderiaceae bacterium]|nr:MAG: hypothetical protein EPO06_04115 [Burkholderiaceae bacterium]
MGNKTLKLWLTLSAIFIISGITVGVVLYSLYRDEVLVERISAIRERMISLASIRTWVVDSETSQRGYVISGNSTFLEPLTTAREHLGAAQKTLRNQLIADASMLELNSTLERLITLHYENIKATLARAAQGNFSQAEQMVSRGQGQKIMDQIRAVIGEMETYHQQRLTAASEERRTAMLWARLATIALGGLILVLIATLAYIIDRELRHRELYQEQLNQEVERLAAELRERAEELDTLSTYLQNSIEKERAQLARDLHDEFGGVLTALKIELAWVEGKAEAYDETLTERTRQVSARVNDLIDLKRRVIENLRPSLLDNLGVEAALTWYARDVTERAGLALELDIDTLALRPASEIAIALFRIAQEAISNTLKYAQATTVRLSLKMKNNQLRLEISDNGVGIDMSARTNKRLTHGLAGMKHRALTLRGQFFIYSTPGQGTTIIAEIPYQSAVVYTPERRAQEPSSSQSSAPDRSTSSQAARETASG